MAGSGADSYRDTTLDLGKVTIKVEEEEDLDSVEGFRKHVSKRLAKFSCVSGNSNKEPPESAPASRDFAETRTTTVTAQMKSHRQTDSYVYDFVYPRRGLAVVINNENFSMSRDFDNRPGSSHDASALYDTFTYLGFDVLLHKDLIAWKMVEVLKQAAQNYDHYNADCLVCAVLTHGDQTWIRDDNERKGSKVRQDLLYGVDGKAVATKNIIDMFNDQHCPGLVGKPRLFFLQACRGTKLDDGTLIRVTRPTFTPHFVGGRSDRVDGGSNIAADETDMTDATAVHGAGSAHSNQPSPAGLKRMESLSSSVDPPEYPKKLLDAVDAKPCEELETTKPGVPSPGTFGSGDGKGTDKPDAFRMHDVPVSPAPLYKDCLVMYATPPGHFAWRRRSGAWFVQCLCQTLKNPESGRKSLLNLLVKVIGMVARDYQSINPSDPKMDAKKETPVIESMLVKDVFLIRKK